MWKLLSGAVERSNIQLTSSLTRISQQLQMYQQRMPSHIPCPSSPALSLAVPNPKSQIPNPPWRQQAFTGNERPLSFTDTCNYTALKIWTPPQLVAWAWCRDDRWSRPWRSQLVGPPNTLGAHSMRGGRLSAPSQFSRGFSRPVQFHVDAPRSTRALHASLMLYVAGNWGAREVLFGLGRKSKTSRGS